MSEKESEALIFERDREREREREKVSMRVEDIETYLDLILSKSERWREQINE